MPAVEVVEKVGEGFKEALSMDTTVSRRLTGGTAVARYKAYDLNQTKMIPLSYADQIVEGSFEHALAEIVEGQLDFRPLRSVTRTTRRAGPHTTRSCC